MTIRARVAILLATYNGARYLEEFLESLARQTRTDFVVFTRDDGSTDSTVAIVDRFLDRLDVRRIPSGTRLGPAESFMTLLSEAGDAFAAYAFADQDDVWMDAKVQRAVEALSAHEAVPALYCTRLCFTDAELRPQGMSRVPRFLSLENALVENVVTGCTAVLNGPARALLLRVRPKSYTMHDWWCYVVIAAFGQVLYDPVPSIQYRQHGGNVIGAATWWLPETSRRISRLLAPPTGHVSLRTQAETFLRLFESELDSTRLHVLRRLTSRPKSLVDRLWLCFASPFVRQRPMDTMILRGLFLVRE